MYLSGLLAAGFATAATAQSGYESTQWQSLPGSIYTPPQDAWAKCKDASWPISDVGTALVPQSPDDELKEMLAEIDPDRVKYIIEKLVSFGTRHTLSSQDDPDRGIGAARDWILHEMQSFMGDNEVYLNSYIQPVASRITFPVNISNVVLQINGTEDPTRAYVVTGHYDSRTLDVSNYTLDAPGADDDASGVAVATEMARVCAKRKPKATMIFSAVAAEEQGLYGSAHLAQTLKQQGYNVEGHWFVILHSHICFRSTRLTKCTPQEQRHRRHRQKRAFQPHQRLHRPLVRSKHLLSQRHFQLI